MNQPEKKKRVCRIAERREARPAVVDPNQLYSIPETAAALDRSRAGIYNEIKAGRIRSVHDGSRHKVAGAEIIRVSREIIERANLSTEVAWMRAQSRVDEQEPAK